MMYELKAYELHTRCAYKCEIAHLFFSRFFGMLLLKFGQVCLLLSFGIVANPFTSECLEMKKSDTKCSPVEFQSHNWTMGNGKVSPFRSQIKWNKKWKMRRVAGMEEDNCIFDEQWISHVRRGYFSLIVVGNFDCSAHVTHRAVRFPFIWLWVRLGPSEI